MSNSSMPLTTGNKRIFIFSLAYHPVIGGAEIAVKEITDRLPDYEFDMVTLRFEDSHPEEEQVGRVRVHRIKSTKLSFPLEAMFYARKLHQERQYSAIWAIMANRAGGAALFFKYSFPEVPFILTLQEGDPIWYIKLRSLYYINPFFRKIFTTADVIQVISNYLADYARTMGYRGRIEVIPNGVDVKKFQNTSNKSQRAEMREKFGFRDEDTVLVTTSRLIGKNAIFDVIRALPKLSKHVKFIIVGTGPSLKKLKTLVQDLGLKERVNFVGHVKYDDIPIYLHASDIFVRPSLSEGFGNSFIEAMAVGLPVIATPVGGIMDFLKDGETGLFAKVRDPESVADQVRRLMKDPDLKEELIKNAQKLVKSKYDWDLVASKMKRRIFDPATARQV